MTDKLECLSIVGRNRHGKKSSDFSKKSCISSYRYISGRNKSLENAFQCSYSEQHYSKQPKR